jgi:magnesium-transporting ATPase (P-type)
MFLVPRNFNEILSNYAKDGFRIIAVGTKLLSNRYDEVIRIERGSLETGLKFLGLFVMENRLKPETKPVIDLLNNVNIRVVMCTGDNILTGLCVANNCNIINENDVIAMVEAHPNQMPTFKYSKIKNKKLVDMQVVNYAVRILTMSGMRNVSNMFFFK